MEGGEAIGYVGNATENGGFSPHLHFEIRLPTCPVLNTAGPGYFPRASAPSPTAMGWVDPSAFIKKYRASTLQVQRLASGGLNDAANTTPTVSAGGTSVGFKNSPTFHLVDLTTGSVQAENSDGDGTLGNGELFAPVFSANSSVKAFASDDANLVANDSNGLADVFVWTQTNGVTERVSVSSTGDQANGASYDVGVSADGRFVAFTSVATNLVANDTNRATDIFVRDRATNQTFLVSLDNNGVQGNGPSYSPSISADGRFVAFISEAANLVTGDTNGVADVFVRDLQANTTVLASKSWSGAPANGPSRQLGLLRKSVQRS